MRWLEGKTKLKANLGDQYKAEAFLWFPKRLRNADDELEWRWLEHALIIYEVLKVDVGGSMEWGNYAYKWYAVKWAS